MARIPDRPARHLLRPVLGQPRVDRPRPMCVRCTSGARAARRGLCVGRAGSLRDAAAQRSAAPLSDDDRLRGEGHVVDEVRRPSPNHADEVYPSFYASMAPDISFFGFDLSAEEIVGNRTSGSGRVAGAGYYIVIQEQPTEPRFGFDVGTPLGDPHAPAGERRSSCRCAAERPRVGPQRRAHGRNRAAATGPDCDPRLAAGRIDVVAGDWRISAERRQHQLSCAMSSTPFFTTSLELPALGQLEQLPTTPLCGSDRPLALFPVRLETRFFQQQDGSREFRVRVYPDKIHLDSHETDLRRPSRNGGRTSGPRYCRRATTPMRMPTRGASLPIASVRLARHGSLAC